MTAAVLARQVDRGELRWDDPVIRHLPPFRMHDPWVTQNMQVRDLLVHNSGLPEGGGDLMLWPEPNDFTRGDIIAGLAHIRPAYSFRAGYAYDNLLYVVAGEVAAAIGHSTYEDLVRQEIFEPLGLDCRVGEWRSGPDDNIAQPHWLVGGRNEPVGADESLVPEITSAAAGGIRCNLDDMMTWAMNWLAPTEKQQAWLSAEQRSQMWTPRTVMPISERSRRWNDTHYYAYSLGFRVADIEGEWTVSHTGSLSGMYSVMYLLPDRQSGFVMLTNGQGSVARTVLAEVLLHLLIAPERAMTADYYIAELEAEPATPQAASVPDTSARHPADPASVQVFLGVWRDPWFGDVSICLRDGTARFKAAKSPMLAGKLMQVADRVLVDWDDDSVDAEAWLDLAKGQDGLPDQLRMAKVDPNADFSFDYEDLAFVLQRDCNSQP